MERERSPPGAHFLSTGRDQERALGEPRVIQNDGLDQREASSPREHAARWRYSLMLIGEVAKKGGSFLRQGTLTVR